MIAPMSLATLALLLVAVLVAAAVPLTLLGAKDHFCELPFGLKTPVLALELIQNKPQVDTLLCAGTPREEGNRSRLRTHTYIDMGVFIPAYFLLFVTLARLSGADLPLLAKVAIVLIAVAAGADYVEDLGILSSLGDGAHLHWTRPAALVKWACFFATLAALSPWWLTRLHWFDKIGGLAMAVSGVWGLWASVFAKAQQIELASNPLLIAFLAVAWRLWRLRAAA